VPFSLGTVQQRQVVPQHAVAKAHTAQIALGVRAPPSVRRICGFRVETKP
jgi:hypothetical protein